MADRDLKLSVIFEGLDRLTGPLKNITNASGGARKAMSETRAELKALTAAQRDIDSFKRAETKLGLDTEEVTKARARLADLKRELDAIEQPTKRMAAAYAAAERNVARLTDRHEETGRELQTLSTRLNSAGIDVAELGQHEDRLALRTREANKALAEQKAKLDQVAKARRQSDEMRDLSGKLAASGAGMIATGVAAGAPVLGAVKDAMTFESAMADVRKVVDFAPPGSFEKMSDDILDLSTRIPIASEGLAQIAAAAGAAGVQRNEIVKFTEDAAKMGVAFGVSADEAGAMMAKWRTAFDIGQGDIVGLADRINALTNAYGGKADAVSEIVTRIGPLGKVAGATAPQIAAMGQLLNAVGIESEIAATGIKNTMLALTKGTAATKGQQGALKSLGLEANQVAKDMQADAGATIMNVMQRIAKLPKEAQAGLLTTLFGSESVAAIAPLLVNLDRLQANFKLIGDQGAYAGSMTKEFIARMEATEGITGIAGNALNALNIELGTALLPTVKELALWLRDLAKEFRGWAQEHPLLAKGLGLFLGVGSALLIIVGGLGIAFAALTAAAAPLGIALAPLLLILAAVAAVAAAAWLIYDNWGAIWDWFGRAWQTLKDLFSEGIQFLISAFLRFTPLGLLMMVMNPAIAWLRSLDFATIGRNLIQGLINGITNMLGALKSTIVNAASSAANWFKQKLGIHSPSRVFMGLGGFVMEGLADGISAGQSDPIRRISAVAGQMTAAMALGAATPAIAAVGLAQGAGASAGAMQAAAGPSYTISIKADGSNADAIAKAVREAIDQIERDRRANALSAYDDD
ncbi:phage tail tape measure protein [Sphingomonas cavernae]|uniref:Phage tail tape measure protein n=1 Tax=Sphingomonas cavernae TaxID=2320861 RepID=A0A418WP34_9SPHN|nr:phage tail tape measure protein [Sphingomonas cavernae]RJF92996.1 phage tail tape measure protein [Sphingomonas cavernae]